MMQQARTAYAHELGDVVERSPLEAVLGKAPERGIEERLARRDPRLAREMRGQDAMRLPRACAGRGRWLMWARHPASLPTRR